MAKCFGPVNGLVGGRAGPAFGRALVRDSGETPDLDMIFPGPEDGDQIAGLVQVKVLRPELDRQVLDTTIGRRLRGI